jgi:hypothetical protein
VPESLRAAMALRSRPRLPISPERHFILSSKKSERVRLWSCNRSCPDR